MAITQTGSVLTLPITSFANTGTVSSTITVPSDAELILVGVSSFQGTANGLEAMTFTKGGIATAMTRNAGGDANSAQWQCAQFYLALPDTGANKTLKWDWVGSGTSSDQELLFSITFWKGVDTTSPVRSSGGAQALSTPYTTPTLTALTGDLIVAFVGAFTAGEGSVNTWSNVSLLANLTANGVADAAWATGLPTGNTTIAASTSTNLQDGGIFAFVLAPAGSGAGIGVAPIRRTGVVTRPARVPGFGLSSQNISLAYPAALTPPRRPWRFGG